MQAEIECILRHYLFCIYLLRLPNDSRGKNKNKKAFLKRRKQNSVNQSFCLGTLKDASVMMFYTFSNVIATSLTHTCIQPATQLAFEIIQLGCLRAAVCPFFSFFQSRAFCLETGTEQFLPDLQINQNLNTILFQQALLICVSCHEM